MSIFLSNIFLAEHIYLAASVYRILQILPFLFFFFLVSHDCVCVVPAYCIVFVKNIFLLFITFWAFIFAVFSVLQLIHAQSYFKEVAHFAMPIGDKDKPSDLRMSCGNC